MSGSQTEEWEGWDTRHTPGYRYPATAHLPDPYTLTPREIREARNRHRRNMITAAVILSGITAAAVYGAAALLGPHTPATTAPVTDVSVTQVAPARTSNPAAPGTVTR